MATQKLESSLVISNFNNCRNDDSEELLPLISKQNFKIASKNRMWAKNIKFNSDLYKIDRSFCMPRIGGIQGKSACITIPITKPTTSFASKRNSKLSIKT